MTLARSETNRSSRGAARPKPDEVYAWNREDRYEPPNFAEFFPNDEAAGKRLDELYQSCREREASVAGIREGMTAKRSSTNTTPAAQLRR